VAADPPSEAQRSLGAQMGQRRMLLAPERKKTSSKPQRDLCPP
jgi:hypothetical protein